MSNFRPVNTKYRTIVSEIPHPDSRALIGELESLEPRSLAGISPVVWHRAEGFQVWDAYGNKWLDFTSAVYLTNAVANMGNKDLHRGNII